MTDKQAEELADFIAEMDLGDRIDVRNDYSGRGMYGQITCAVVTDAHPESITGAIAAAKKASPCFDEEWPELEDLDGLRSDNMGFDYVVY